MKLIRFAFLAAAICLLNSCSKKDSATAEQRTGDPAPREIWSKEKANEWYKTKGWLRGSDYIPSTAINQLEMWQAETFDTATINRELGWAESIGFNSMRVYLHHLAWQVDSAGFKNRMNTYLSIADATASAMPRALTGRLHQISPAGVMTL